MKDKKKKNRLWSGEFKLKFVLDIIENDKNSCFCLYQTYAFYMCWVTYFDTPAHPC